MRRTIQSQLTPITCSNIASFVGRRQLSSLRSRSRLGIGSTKLAHLSKDGLFSSIIATALQNGGVPLFECGDVKSEEELVRAYMDAFMYLNDRKKHGESNDIETITITSRLGYKTMDDTPFANDVLLENSTATKVFHNISKQYISSVMRDSALIKGSLKMADSFPSVPSSALKVCYLIQNPEVQSIALTKKGAPIDEARALVKERLTEAFAELETNVAEKHIGSYGICANGLSLPSSHPLHLNWKDVLYAASEAARKVYGHDYPDAKANISTLQLPINLLETYGLIVASRVKQFLASPSEEKTSNLPKKINIHATRPLTCYPNRGTGEEFPFKLVDQLLPTSNNPDAPKQWTHEMEGSTPSFYHGILNETMGYFDATHLLEAVEEGRKLTTVERETLDGCKLLQSMIHDLDANLSSGNIRSFERYEEELYHSVVPLIKDTFEELDEQSSILLEKFFKAHGVAVRHSIARTTRNLLKDGKEGGVKYDIGNNQSLQEFALQFLLQQRIKDGELNHDQRVIDKIIVGCTQPEHVINMIQIADRFDQV